ncbi:MAG: ferritin [archaeon]
MNISKKIQEVMNKQINHEFYSAYLYLGMAAYFENQNLKGFANWMKKQAQEEMTHGMKFFNFINERNGEVSLEMVAKPAGKWKSPLQVFEEAYAHELKVTELIYNIVALATAEKDYASKSFLKWFVDEQVEEEANASEIVHKLKLAGDSKGALIMLDRELGARQ